MKTSEINFKIILDENNVPEKIDWIATDKPGESESTNAINISVWDNEEKNTMRIDLWTKEMQVHEMKKFYIDNLGGMSQSILSATGDEVMATAINDLCDKLGKHLEQELKQS